MLLRNVCLSRWFCDVGDSLKYISHVDEIASGA